MTTPIGNRKVNVALGIVGLCIAITANFLPFNMTQKILYFLAAVFLLSSAALERQVFFVLLQVVILVGTGLAMTSAGYMIKILAPIILSIAAIIYLFKKGDLRDYLLFIGALGLSLLAIGYAISNPIVYLFGGSVLAIYSFISYRRGIQIALIWGVLNSVFALTALVSIYHWL